MNENTYSVATSKITQQMHEFKSKYNRLTSNNLKKLQVNLTGGDFAALESVVSPVSGTWGFGPSLITLSPLYR